MAKASDTLEKRLTKKSLMKTCCKICPGDRYPGLGLNALQPAFIELMSKKVQDACCPICPTLASLSMAGAEPFGGPFGLVMVSCVGAFIGGRLDFGYFVVVKLMHLVIILNKETL